MRRALFVGLLMVVCGCVAYNLRVEKRDRRPSLGADERYLMSGQLDADRVERILLGNLRMLDSLWRNGYLTRERIGQIVECLAGAGKWVTLLRVYDASQVEAVWRVMKPRLCGWAARLRARMLNERGGVSAVRRELGDAWGVFRRLFMGTGFMRRLAYKWAESGQVNEYLARKDVADVVMKQEGQEIGHMGRVYAEAKKKDDRVRMYLIKSELRAVMRGEKHGPDALVKLKDMNGELEELCEKIAKEELERLRRMAEEELRRLQAAVLRAEEEAARAASAEARERAAALRRQAALLAQRAQLERQAAQQQAITSALNWWRIYEEAKMLRQQRKGR